MKKLVKKDKLFFLIFFIFIVGCVTVEEMPILEGQNKITIERGWGRKPNKVYYNSSKLKYGADELWIYEFSGGGDEAKYFFKNDILIKREHVSYATL